MNLLGSLQLHTPKDHPDQTNIIKNYDKIRQVYLFIKKLEERLKHQYELLGIQRIVIEAPVKEIFLIQYKKKK